MRRISWIACSLSLASSVGCTVAERDYTGPMIRMQLVNNDFDTVEDTSVMPSFRLSTGDTEYSIAIEIFTTSGGLMTSTTSTSSKVSNIRSTFSLAGTDLQSPTFTSDNSTLDPRFKTAAPIVIPGSSLGSVLNVHATAVDGNDLNSNVIDLAIDLK
ncbi:hypothetical protein BH11MYX1_BH11MYX1_29960 [soil metagenome]